MIYDDMMRELAALGISKPKTRATQPDLIARARAVVTDYNDGLTIREIEAAHDISSPQIYAHLRRAGIRLRREAPDMPSCEELMDALTRWGVSGVAEEYGVSARRARQWRAHYGL